MGLGIGEWFSDLHETCQEYGSHADLPIPVHLKVPHHRNGKEEDVKVQYDIECALDYSPYL